MVEKPALPTNGEGIFSYSRGRRFALVVVVSCVGCVWQFIWANLSFGSVDYLSRSHGASVSESVSESDDDELDAEWRRETSLEELEKLWRSADEAASQVMFANELERERKDTLETPRLCKRPIFGNYATLVNHRGRVRRLFKPDKNLGIPAQDTNDELAIKNLKIHGIPLDEANATVGTCALVSTAGAYLGYGMGEDIDKFDLVFRMNWGGAVLPLLRPDDFGSRTNVLYLSHHDFSSCARQNCRLCVPHVLDEKARRPSDIMQITIVEVNSGELLKSFLSCREQLGADGWRLQIAHPDILEMDKKSFPFIDKYKFARGSSFSAGFITFFLAKAMCLHVMAFGFFGTTNMTAPFHAYRWCDVDRILRLTTRDCQSSVLAASEKTDDGFVFNMSELGHDFDTERRYMYTPMLRNPECRLKCVCSSKLLPRPPTEAPANDTAQNQTNETA